MVGVRAVQDHNHAQITLARQTRHRTIAYPAQPPTLPERFRGLPVIDRARCRDGLPPMRRGMPDRCDRAGRRWSAHGPGAMPVLQRLHGGLPGGGRALHAGPPAGNPAARGSSHRRPRIEAGRGVGGEIAAAVRPLAQVAAGQRGGLQCLRGGSQRVGYRGLRHRAASASSLWPRRAMPTASSSPAR